MITLAGHDLQLVRRPERRRLATIEGPPLEGANPERDNVPRAGHHLDKESLSRVVILPLSGGRAGVELPAPSSLGGKRPLVVVAQRSC
jgi:hypothetical protein